MHNKMISLFSGAGGLDIGFHDAGFETAVLVERDSACCQTLRTNMPNVPVIEGDINEISTESMLTAGHLKPLEAALVVGGPPCQSFSLAGKRMGLNDPRGKLVLEFIRVVREALPIGFVMENVRGLANWEHGRALEAIIEEASQPVKYQGRIYRYEVQYQILNAASFGAPQFRERIFIVGNRIHVPFKFPSPTHGDVKSAAKIDLFGREIKPYVTVNDAIGKLPPATPPSKTALRVAGTIKERIVKHGY